MIAEKSIVSQASNQEKTPIYIGFSLDNLPRTVQIVLNEILQYVHYKNVFVAQGTIAKKIGLSRSTVNKALNYLKSLGLIWWDSLHNYTNVYFFHAMFYDPQVRRKLAGIFRSLSYLSLGILAFNLPGKHVTSVTETRTRLISKEDLFINVTVTAVTTEGSPSTRVRAREAVTGGVVTLNTEKEMKMLPFTEEQLLSLKQYSNEALNYATKILTKDIHSGKQINDKFKYFLAICQRHESKPQQQVTAKKPTPKQLTPAELDKRIEDGSISWSFSLDHEPKMHAYITENKPGENALIAGFSSYHWKRLKQEQQQYFMDTLHIDCNCRQIVETVSVAKKEETDLEFCTIVEPKLHALFLEKNIYGFEAGKAWSIARWNKLTPEQKSFFMSAVHINCSCRPTVDNSSTVQKKPVEPLSSFARTIVDIFSQETILSDGPPAARDIPSHTPGLNRDIPSHFDEAEWEEVYE